MDEERKKRIRLIGLALFIAYLVLLNHFLFFAEEYGRQALSEEMQYNLVPFREIRRFWNNRQTLGMSAVMLNILGNVAAFIPLGMILPVITPFIHIYPGAAQTVIAGFVYSLLVEITQMLTKVGSFDVDDLMLNTLGTAVGYLLFILGKKVFHGRRKSKLN